MNSQNHRYDSNKDGCTSQSKSRKKAIRSQTSRQKLYKKLIGARKYFSIRLKRKWVQQELQILLSYSELDGSLFEKMAMFQKKKFQWKKIFKIDIFAEKKFSMGRNFQNTSMIAQNYCNKLLSHCYFYTFFLVAQKNCKNVIFYPKNAQKS